MEKFDNLHVHQIWQWNVVVVENIRCVNNSCVCERFGYPTRSLIILDDTVVSHILYSVHVVLVGVVRRRFVDCMTIYFQYAVRRFC